MDEDDGNMDPPEVFDPSSSAEPQGEDQEWKEEPEFQDDVIESGRGSVMWWFGINGNPSSARRSPFRKVVVGVALLVCIIWMLSQTVCASGPM